MAKIKIRRGTRAQLDALATSMNLGELMYCTDTNELYMGTGDTTKVPILVDISALTDLGAVASGDFIYMYDISATGTTVKARKITFADFKTALNIPAGSSDEKVATASGASADYLGADGTTGILRTGDGITMTPGASNAFTTLKLALASQAQGDIIYRGATAWSRLPADTAGKLLMTGGAGANPSWTDTIDGGSF